MGNSVFTLNAAGSRATGPNEQDGSARGAPSNPGPPGVQVWMSDSRKQSLYFPEEMLREIQQQALRLDRSLSWIVQQAWRAARAHLASIPGTAEVRVAQVSARRVGDGSP